MESGISTINSEFEKYHVKREKDHTVKNGNYQRKREYCFKSSKINIFYKPKFKSEFVPQYSLLSIHQPDQYAIDMIRQVLFTLVEIPKLKKIELDWDFYTKSVWSLQEFLERHLFLKYQRGDCQIYKNTYYTNDLRQSTRGIRVYPRPIDNDNKKFVRL
jgi:hypothetical protein